MTTPALDDAVPYRALQRLMYSVAATSAQPPDSAGSASTPASTPAAPTVQQHANTRRERLATADRAAWRATKGQLLQALANLRAEQAECVTYQSPDFQRAAMLKPVELHEIPAMPLWHGKEGRAPAENDRSDEAERWRAECGIRERMLDQWRATRLARRTLRPYNTWRNLGSAGERGGMRPGQHAWPSAWTPYLLRVDPEGPMGTGWMSPLGVAFRRIERDYAETPLLRVLWLYTDPDHYGDMARIMAAVRLSQSRCYVWLDAASRRLSAEMTAVVHGGQAPQAKHERRDADEAEALAWKGKGQDNG